MIGMDRHTGAALSGVEHLRQSISLPIGVGFGIRDAQSARAVAAVADAVVIGTRIIQEIESAGPAGAVGAVEAFVRGIRDAIDAPVHA